VLLFSFLAKDVNGHVQPDENGYIIEFSTENERTLFLNENQGNIMRLRYHFDSDILTGLAVEFKSDKVAKQLLRNPEIINSWPIHHHVRQHAPINFDNILDQVTNVTENTDDVKTTRFNPQNKVCVFSFLYSILSNLNLNEHRIL
jgi:hypothetical protein